ncbi:MAG TPA: hypothetical protein VE135_20090 [Pyrinomonadaceae bacterium]|nr:hypothetical protein [Pyrinomonadaceae bacterium]
MPGSMIVVAALALSISASAFVAAQKVGGAGGTVKQPTSPRGVDAPVRSTKVPVKTVVRTVIERVTPTTGSLSVAAESNATLLVEPLNVKRAQAQQGVVPAGEKIFVFNDLKPGRYRLAGSLEGHRAAEKEVEIAANKSQSATLDFQPILYSVTINTNITSGELKYAPEGQRLSNVVPIQNSSVRLDLPAGKYEVEITADDFGYETRHHNFALTGDKTVLDVPLKRIALTTDTLSPKWTAAELQAWYMPAGWAADSKKNLAVKGAGVALPREEGYRYYKDFKLSSTAKMVNGVALSFALRARDPQNYYLLQLTGERSDEPYTVRLFVVKNGVEQRIRAIPIPRAGAKAMAADQFFTISVKMVDYAITVEIEDSDTGAPYPLGVLTDPARNFAVGAVGIAGRSNEDNVIGRFVVCTGDKCLSE